MAPLAPWRWLRDRLGPVAWSYVAVVAVLCAVGFTQWDAGLVTTALVATLPASLVALVADYVVLGLLGQVPGANPSHASGSGLVSSTARLEQASQGGPAAWYLAAGPVILAASLVLAAVINAVLVRAALGWWRRRRAAQP